MKEDKKSGLKLILFIQGAVIVYSFCGVFQKLAAQHSMLSIEFLLLYGCSIFILMVYAVLWQIILKHVPLTTAYSNRAIAMIWSLVWSVILFQESVSWNQVFGALVICFGVYKVIAAGEE